MARNGKWQSQALCPFFRAEVRKNSRISCAGLAEGQTMQINFAAEDDRQRWLRDKCASWDYASCPYYIAAEAASEGWELEAKKKT